jgi:DNA modification methylase
MGNARNRICYCWSDLNSTETVMGNKIIKPSQLEDNLTAGQAKARDDLMVAVTKSVQWPADNIQRRNVSDLVPYARNARTHSDAQVAQIAASMKEWGWTNPVLIDEHGGIIAGHGRVLAAQRLNIPQVPTMTAVGWSDAKKRAYILADNQLALNAGWDMDMLKVEIGELDGLEFDISLIGFDDDFLANLLIDGTDGLTDPDAIPETPENPITVEGDVWVMGNHRIICGDSTSADTVDKLLGSVKPHLMVTDPPYGVEYDANWRNEALRADGSAIGARAVGKVENDDKADWSEAYALFPGDVAYVWHASTQSHVFAKSLVDSGFDVRALIIWAKQQFAIGRGNYHHQHEPCWYVVRKKSGATAHWTGDRKQSTLWQIDKPQKSDTGHSTQKPVECMKRPIENNSSPGQAVYEPFSGSGTTIIAGEMTGRHIYAIELNPAYVDVAVKRWQEFTGEDAIHEASKKTFNELSNVETIDA